MARTASDTPFGPWVSPYRPRSEARFCLFCLSHAGAGASTYRSWLNALPPEILVCPVQLPGREQRLREPAFTSVAVLVAALSEVLRSYRELPFAIYGHSMGALLAFELARQLRRTGGAQQKALFVSGRRAPQLPEQAAPIHQLPDDLFLRELTRMNGMQAELLDSTEFMEIMLPTIRADFELCETYRYLPEAPLNCSITAFGGLADPLAESTEIDRWREQTTSGFSSQMLPGGHFFIQTARADLLQLLRQELRLIMAG